MHLRIRDIRKTRRLTGEQLADMVGVTKGYISELETGKKKPGADVLIRLADALECQVADLFEGDTADVIDAELQAHLEVMSKLSFDDRRAIEKAALGLLAKQSG